MNPKNTTGTVVDKKAKSFIADSAKMKVIRINTNK